MRQKALKIISLCFALLLLCTGCTDDSMRASADSSMLGDLRSAYRAASLICVVTCTGRVKGVDGSELAIFEVSELLAGSAPAGELLCKDESPQIGADYIAYLSSDDASQPWLAISLIPYDQGSAMLTQDAQKFPISALREDIQFLQSVISAPADLMYYRDAQELLDACDAVFIGRVKALPALDETNFREASGAGTVEHSRPASIVEVQVYGSIKGDLPYGGSVSFIYSPAFAGDIVNAASLTAFPCLQSDVPALTQNEYYLFFLKNGPDPKQDYYFGVNPLQSHVSLAGDTLQSAAKNEALAAYSELPDLLSAFNG